MGKNSFIMISGPAASGKSTLVKNLNINLGAKIFKPSLSYILLAQERGIAIDRAFDDISRSDGDKHFCEVCKKNEIVIGDQHLAIQPNKDSSLATSGIVVTTDEPYVSALDYSLFMKLNEEDIRTLLIYLKASPEVLFQRALERHKNEGMFLRNQNVKETLEEAQAEYYYFNQLVNSVPISNCVIDTDDKTEDEVLGYALRKINDFRR